MPLSLDVALKKSPADCNAIDEHCLHSAISPLVQSIPQKTQNGMVKYKKEGSEENKRETSQERRARPEPYVFDKKPGGTIIASF
jgi:hypothetical protein